MAKISTETIENLKEFMDRENGYAGTQEIVDELTVEILRWLGARYPYPDEISLLDGDDQFFATIDEFANRFWDKAVDKILNVLETEE